MKDFLRTLRDKFIPYSRIRGNGNKIIIVESNGHEKDITKSKRIPKLSIRIIGNGNVIKISDQAIFWGRCGINLAECNNANIEIHESHRIKNMNIRSKNSDNIRFIWGGGSTVWGCDMILNETDAGIIIGRNCMLSSDIQVWAADSHAIFDAKIRQLLNRVKQPVVIGDHCWLGYYCLLTKNAGLAENTIVGAGSVVTKVFTESNVAIAGNPARIVKSGINFSEDKPHNYKESK